MPGLLASRRNKQLVGSTKNGASLKRLREEPVSAREEGRRTGHEDGINRKRARLEGSNADNVDKNMVFHSYVLVHILNM